MGEPQVNQVPSSQNTENNNPDNVAILDPKKLIRVIPDQGEQDSLELQITLPEQVGNSNIPNPLKYQITYKKELNPPTAREKPYISFEFKDNTGADSQPIGVFFTDNLALKIKLNGLLGGDFKLFKDYDSEDNFLEEGSNSRLVSYQTISNFETSFFQKTYCTSLEQNGKVNIQLLINEEPIYDLWSRYDESTGNAWAHKVPIPNLETPEQNAEFGGNLLITIISNLLLRMMATNFNLSVKDDDDTDNHSDTISNTFVCTLPKKDDLRDIRSVDLNPIELNAKLEEQGLHFRWSTISSVCASLNSGKNLILVGPPGCGKTKLAVELAKFGENNTSSGSLLCTASPAWTTGDLVGRYLPHANGKGLVFDEGFFLKAIDQSRWLIVDEINRANIDSCFGELFSILSEHSVELPFKVENTNNAETGTNIEYSQVGVIPHSQKPRKGYKDYIVSPSFRMIGTMNDADRGQLATLSFALQRRFNTLYIDPPNKETIEKIIDNKFDKLKDNIWGKDNEFAPKINNLKDSHIEPLRQLFKHFFAGGDVNEGNTGLVSANIIGVSIMLDSMRFVFEGMREMSSDKVGLIRVKVGDNEKKLRASEQFECYMKSWLAKSLVALLFPQLEAVNEDKIKIAVGKMKGVFNGVVFISRTATAGTGNKLKMEQDVEFQLIVNFLKQYMAKHFDPITNNEFWSS